MTSDTVHSTDLALTAVRARYLKAEEAGDLVAAALAYRRLDELLEQRIQLPHQRPA